MKLVQLRLPDGSRGVAADGVLVKGARSVRELAGEAIARRQSLAEAVAAAGLRERVDLHVALAEGRVLPPVDHDDPAHLLLTGTGLTHLGSAEERDRMHAKLADTDALTDSMKMFKLGLEGGRPMVWAMRWNFSDPSRMAPLSNWPTSARWISCHGVCEAG
jgi:hypothetical protein